MPARQMRTHGHARRVKLLPTKALAFFIGTWQNGEAAEMSSAEDMFLAVVRDVVCRSDVRNRRVDRSLTRVGILTDRYSPRAPMDRDRVSGVYRAGTHAACRAIWPLALVAPNPLAFRRVFCGCIRCSHHIA
jgi:hypothetical protein